jgi:peptidyl-prolyl cis-trans isomerase B (cyclophilin B)
VDWYASLFFSSGTIMKATINTSKGSIVLELDTTAAPDTCANFKRYADEGHYASTIFHRVIPNFMIQGGGFTADMNQKRTHANIRNEAANGLKNDTGTIAMARTPDPHSASSQFFINLVDNDFLNYRDDSQAGFGYCVFGKTVEGMDTIASIAAVATSSSGAHQDVPVEAVVIESITVTED